MPVFLWAATSHAADPVVRYGIETIAGNGMTGDIPKDGGIATEVPVDLPFGVEYGPDGALYITTVGTHPDEATNGSRPHVDTMIDRYLSGYRHP